MNTELSGQNTVGTELALMRQRLDIVIMNHDKQLSEHNVLLTSASSQINVLQLQANTHEVKIAELQQKAMGTFSKVTVTISVAVALITLFLGLAS